MDRYRWRRIGVYLDIRFLDKPELMVGSAHERFDAEGRVTHEPTRKFVGDLLVALGNAVRSSRG